MTRNDAFMTTGMSSAVDRRLKQVKTERKEKGKAETERVAPVAEPVMALIAAMKDNVTNVKHVMLNDVLTDEQKLKTMERMKQDYELLTQVENNLKKLFKRQKEAEDE